MILARDARIACVGLKGAAIHEVEKVQVGAVTIPLVASADFAVSGQSGVRTRGEMQGYIQVIVSGPGARDYPKCLPFTRRSYSSAPAVR